MKVTKNILREMIEAEMKLLNEARTVNAINKSLAQAQKLIKDEIALAKKESRDKKLLRDLGDGAGQKLFDRLTKDKKKLAGWTLIKNNDTVSDLTAAIDQSLATMTTEQGVLDKIAAGVKAAELANKSPDDDDTAGVGAAAQSSGSSTSDSGTPSTTATGALGTLTEPEKAMLQAIATKGGRVLKRGSKSPKVGLLQSALAKRLTGDDTAITALGKPDNAFGPKTKAAVEKLQTAYGMSGSDLDGKVGKNTAASLLKGARDSGVAVRRSRSVSGGASADSETAAAETYANSNPFGNDIGIWNRDAKVWFATNWARASTESKEAGWDTAIKLENEDGVRYVKEPGNSLTEDDINELLDDDGAQTDAEANPLPGQSVVIPAQEAVNYFKRFTRYLNEIDSMRDDRSFTDIMAVEDPVEDAPGEEGETTEAPAEADATEASNITVTTQIEETVYNIAPDEANVEFPEDSGIMWTKDDSIAGGSADWALDENIYWSNGENTSYAGDRVMAMDPFGSKGSYSTWKEVKVGVSKDDTLYSFRDELDADPGIFHNIEDAWFKQNIDSNRLVVPNGTEITVGPFTWKKEDVSSEEQWTRTVLSTTWADGSGKWKNGDNIRDYADEEFIKYEKAALSVNESVSIDESLSYDRFQKLAGLLKG
jgi:peptidoglycan hydrolase-like protein with peptidoglycan-binding domain